MAATYVTEEQFRKYAYIDSTDTDVTDNIQLAIDSAEVEVDNDLDYASLADYADDEGALPAPLVKAILMKALQGYDNPDGTHSSSVATDYHYEKLIKPYVKLVETTTTEEEEEES